ncbi:Dabb family protein [Wenyingzhuangia sp. IMCC45467]
MKENNFYHNVFFWLKEPSNKEHCLQFTTALQEFLHASVYTKTAVITKPAHTNREVVDNSYTYGLLVSFDNQEKHELYQNEPAHQLFLKEASHLWEKVQIFDSVTI